jgi:hypothetical protein
MSMERNMYKEKIIDVATGKETWRDYTDSENAEVEAAQAEAAELTAKEAEAQAKRLTAKTKLQALGLDEADLKALGL